MNKEKKYEEILVSFFNDFCEFYEVKINNARLLYWEHRSNLVTYNSNRRINIFIPTCLLRNTPTSHFKTKDFQSDFNENIDKYLTYCMSINLFTIVNISITNRKLIINTKDNEFIFFKNGVSVNHDDLKEHINKDNLKRLI